MPDTTPTITSRSGVLLVVCAPSGTGKTTLIQRLRDEFPNFAYSISCTTRAPRGHETDGKDYLIELDGHPLAGDQVKPTGTRYPVDGDGIRLLSPVIPSKVYGLAKNYEAHAQFMHEAGHSEIARRTW